MKLSICTSNRDRLDPNSNSTQLFFKSLENQTFKDFELVIADGGSKNIEELKKIKVSFPIKFVSFIIGEKFERSRLNNVAVRNSIGDYAMTTDVDMCYGPDFMQNVIDVLNNNPNAFVESRTLYWKSRIANMVYKGELNPFKDINSCREGRIKKRSTAGGCQCMSKENWEKIRGFDEAYVGWGSEDTDLLTRVKKSGIKVAWIGESRESIQLFHQPHGKSQEQHKEDLDCQEENKKLLAKAGRNIVNPNGWGGINE